MIKIYGLKNCDTCKKATKWLDAENMDYEFIDIRNPAPNVETLTLWLAEIGEKKLINRRSTSWRNLTDEQKNSQTDEEFLALINENSTLIKRPIFVKEGQISVGFSPKSPPF